MDKTYKQKEIKRIVQDIVSIADSDGAPLYHVWYEPYTVYWKIFMRHGGSIAVSELRRNESEHLWMWDKCSPQDITATDLLDILRDYPGFRAFRIYIWMEKKMAEGVYSSTLERMGIAQGTDATFATIEYMGSPEKSIEWGIEMYLNDPAEWEKRN